jgi:hypothetical protein
MDVRDGQVPEKSWIMGSSAPNVEPGLMEILVAEAVAENRYQTSSSGSPDAQPAGMEALAVAFDTRPFVLIFPTVKRVALLHSSLGGAPEYDTQIE